MLFAPKGRKALEIGGAEVRRFGLGIVVDEIEGRREGHSNFRCPAEQSSASSDTATLDLR